jgi:hypothetical protein
MDAIAIPIASPFDSLTPQVQLKAFQYSGAYAAAEFCPGVVDPADASHFTIPYDDPGGRRHILHGYLQDDGTVKFNSK